MSHMEHMITLQKLDRDLDRTQALVDEARRMSFGTDFDTELDKKQIEINEKRELIRMLRADIALQN